VGQRSGWSFALKIQERIQVIPDESIAYPIIKFPSELSDRLFRAETSKVVDKVTACHEQNTFVAQGTKDASEFNERVEVAPCR
jgi:hypothetical protein